MCRQRIHLAFDQHGNPCSERRVVEAVWPTGGEYAGTSDAQTATFTTLMIRNLPRKILQSHLAREIDASSFAGLYDFLYMPSEVETGKGKGYAFINFINPEAAKQFRSSWLGTKRFPMDGESALNISFAYIQGRDANIDAWCARNTKRIRNPELRPLVLDGGRRELEPWQPPNQGRTKAKQDTAAPARLAPSTPQLDCKEASQGSSVRPQFEAMDSSTNWRDVSAASSCLAYGIPAPNAKPSNMHVRQIAHLCHDMHAGRLTMAQPAREDCLPAHFAAEAMACRLDQFADERVQCSPGSDQREELVHQTHFVNLDRAPQTGGLRRPPVVKLVYVHGELRLMFE